jgi:alginate O-acetyltransferase complex protein AlgI
LWHGGSGTALLWAGYSGGWLALEAIGLSLLIERAPRWVRHVYLLLVVLVGWVVLRAETADHAWLMLKAMAGWSGASAFPARRFLGFEIWTALVIALIGAGPLVPWISRWRVTVDATTAAVVMMLSAMSLWVWRGIGVIAAPLKTLRSRSTSDRNASSSSL